MDQDEKCHACGRKFGPNGKRYQVQVRGEDQAPYVGASCYRAIGRAERAAKGDPTYAGWKHPKSPLRYGWIGSKG